MSFPTNQGRGGLISRSGNSMSDAVEVGKSYEVRCPFVRTTYTEVDEDGTSEVPTWRPGVEWVNVGYFGEAEARHDGVGSVVYTVVDFHRLPRPYPPRVFFTRKWVSPDGHRFGKNRLHIMTLEAFRRRLQSYKFEGWEYADDYLEAAE